MMRYHIYFGSSIKKGKYYNYMSTKILKNKKEHILYSEVEIKKDTSEDENYCYLVHEIIEQAESIGIKSENLVFFDSYCHKNIYGYKEKI